MAGVQLRLLTLKCCFQFNSRILRTNFTRVMTSNNSVRNDCRNAKLHFQMTFPLSSTSSSLKLPRVTQPRIWPLIKRSCVR